MGKRKRKRIESRAFAFSLPSVVRIDKSGDSAEPVQGCSCRRHGGLKYFFLIFIVFRAEIWDYGWRSLRLRLHDGNSKGNRNRNANTNADLKREGESDEFEYEHEIDFTLYEVK